MRTKEDWIAIIIVALIAFGVFGTCGKAHAEPISEGVAVRCILGEAEDQGYDGMLQLAYALQNRGTTSGVYGLKAISWHNNAYYRGDRRISKETASQALKAFKTAKMTQKYNRIGNSKHWENVKDFGNPIWAIGHDPFIVIGDHAFYEGIR